MGRFILPLKVFWRLRGKLDIFLWINRGNFQSIYKWSEIPVVEEKESSIQTYWTPEVPAQAPGFLSFLSPTLIIIPFLPSKVLRTTITWGPCATATQTQCCCALTSAVQTRWTAAWKRYWLTSLLEPTDTCHLAIFWTCTSYSYCSLANPHNELFFCPQWKTEILDFCPSTRILLIGCKTDLRTDVCTLMELSNQKQTPIAYEQVRNENCDCWAKQIFGMRTATFISWSIPGFSYGQAAGCRGLPGVLSVHLREEHPQRVPHRSDGVHQQVAADPKAQPNSPPLQKTSSPAQQVWFALFHLQEGEDQELLSHVSGDLLGYGLHKRSPAPASLVSGKGGWARWLYQGFLLNPSLTPPETKRPSEEVDTLLSTCSWTL